MQNTNPNDFPKGTAILINESLYSFYMDPSNFLQFNLSPWGASLGEFILSKATGFQFTAALGMSSNMGVFQCLLN